MQITAKKSTYTQRSHRDNNVIQVRLDWNDFQQAVVEQPNPLWFSYDIGSAVAPRRALRGNRAPVDLTQEMTRVNLEDIQSVYVDNSINPGLLQLNNYVSGQTIMVPPYSQGVYPVFSVPGTKSSQWDVITADHLYTAQRPAFGEMSTAATAPVVGASGLVAREAIITLIFTDATMPIGTWTLKHFMAASLDISGVIAVGGAFQALAAVGPGFVSGAATINRRGFLIENPITALEPLYVGLNDTYVADALGNAIALVPGERYAERGNDAFAGTLNVMAATAAHAFTAKIFW